MWLLSLWCLICQLDWAKGCLDSWQNIIFGCVGEDIFQKRLAFESVNWVKTALTKVGGHHPICWELNWGRIWRKGEFALCLSWDIHLHLSLDISAPSSPAYGLGLGFTPLALLIFRPLGWDRNHTTRFFSLQSTHSRLGVLLSLHNGKSQPP